jgi:hypothetical protein
VLTEVAKRLAATATKEIPRDIQRLAVLVSAPRAATIDAVISTLLDCELTRNVQEALRDDFSALENPLL